MRILELIPSLIDGGAERFILDISKEFIEQSHEVCIASLFPESEEGLKYFSDWDPQIERAFLDKKLGFDPKVILRLRKLIKEYRPDIIHTHLRVVNYLAIAKLMGGISQPIVHTVHNDAAQEVGSDKEQKFRHFLFKSGRIHPVSISGMSDDSFKKIYEGVDVHRIDNGRSFPEKTEDFH
jgi:glycosyltransferase involved in cell wall biosynthesis